MLWRAVKIHTWTQALALFVQCGGANDDFLNQCQFTGMADKKLGVLAAFLFQTQQPKSDFSSMTFPTDTQTKWLEAFPNETAFLENLFFIPRWDQLEASNNLQALRAEARFVTNVNPQVMRITPNHSGSIL